MSINPKSFINKNALEENISTLWKKYDVHGEHNQKGADGKLQCDEFKNLLYGCAKNWAYKLAVKTFGDQIYNNLKSCSKNKQCALSKQDIFTYARQNKININERDSINTLIDKNIKGLNAVIS